jgi:hypothetical protein
MSSAGRGAKMMASSAGWVCDVWVITTERNWESHLNELGRRWGSVSPPKSQKALPGLCISDLCKCVRVRLLQALVDRPDETRRVISFKRMTLTDLKIDIPRLAKKPVVKKAFEDAGEPRSKEKGSGLCGSAPRHYCHWPLQSAVQKLRTHVVSLHIYRSELLNPPTPKHHTADVLAKFAASAWGQKLAKREARKSMGDFDRYKATVAKIKRSAEVRRAAARAQRKGM